MANAVTVVQLETPFCIHNEVKRHKFRWWHRQGCKDLHQPLVQTTVDLGHRSSYCVSDVGRMQQCGAETRWTTSTTTSLMKDIPVREPQQVEKGNLGPPRRHPCDLSSTQVFPSAFLDFLLPGSSRSLLFCHHERLLGICVKRDLGIWRSPRPRPWNSTCPHEAEGWVVH